VKTFTNQLESYAATVHTGVTDEETSYALLAGLITRYCKILKPLIDEQRDRGGNVTAMMELEKLAQVWQPRRDREIKQLKQDLEEIEERTKQEREKVIRETLMVHGVRVPRYGEATRTDGAQGRRSAPR
jgi:uncharacterized protein DUF4760